VGRPGLDPGTLGATASSAESSLNVQIRWSNYLGRPPMSSEILPSLISWLDEWLDRGSCTGLAKVQFEAAGGEIVRIDRGQR
jgi:hypothetical protein